MNVTRNILFCTLLSCAAQGNLHAETPPGTVTLTLNVHEYTLNPNDLYQLYATIEPESPTQTQIYWSTKKNGVIYLYSSPPGQIRALKTGTTVVYAKLSTDTTIMDSCVITVSATSPCTQGTYETSDLTFCSNAEQVITCDNASAEWYDSQDFSNAIGFGDTLRLKILTDSALDVFQTSRADTCMTITRKYRVSIVSPPEFDSSLLLAFDTICTGNVYLFPYTDLLWYKNSTDTIATDTGSAFPGDIVLGTNTYYLQRTLNCKTPFITFAFLQRDCSHDFTPKYYIYGNVNPHTGFSLPDLQVFLLDANNDYTSIDSCSTSTGSFVLRVPNDGRYTFMAVPPAGNIYATTYYGNTTSLEKSTSIAVNSYIKGIDISLQLSLSLTEDEVDNGNFSIIPLPGKRVAVRGTDNLGNASLQASTILGKTRNLGAIRAAQETFDTPFAEGLYLFTIMEGTKALYSRVVLISR